MNNKAVSKILSIVIIIIGIITAASIAAVTYYYLANTNNNTDQTNDDPKQTLNSLYFVGQTTLAVRAGIPRCFSSGMKASLTLKYLAIFLLFSVRKPVGNWSCSEPLRTPVACKAELDWCRCGVDWDTVECKLVREPSRCSLKQEAHIPLRGGSMSRTIPAQGSLDFEEQIQLTINLPPISIEVVTAYYD